MTALEQMALDVAEQMAHGPPDPLEIEVPEHEEPVPESNVRRIYELLRGLSLRQKTTLRDAHKALGELLNALKEEGRDAKGC